MDEALRALRKDPKMRSIIKKYGVPSLTREGTPFQALVRAIIYQQLSGKAAGTIFARFRALFPGKKFPTPSQVSTVPVETLRAVGLSGQKASYLHDLAQKFADGTISVRRLRAMPTPELTTHLTQVKGVGVWTVHMFSIFTLRRLDVLPVGDLGIRKGFQVTYGLKNLPTPAEMEKLAEVWRPYASVASWYLWRAADAAKEK